jgi:hypothetical protein
MKSSQPNNPDNPSASNQRENPCFGTDSTVAALNVVADGEHSYLLPYAHFLYSERISNPALEKEPDAPPEKMLIRFARAQVIVLGSGLKTLERAIQKYELKFVKMADERLASTLNTHIAGLIVTLTRENV